MKVDSEVAREHVASLAASKGYRFTATEKGNEFELEIVP